MPKVKIRAVNPTGYWIVDQAEHQKALDEHKQKTGWVVPVEVQKLQQAGIVVPPHMLAEPLLPQKPGKFIPASETEMELSDEEVKMLQADPNVMLLTGQQGDLTEHDKQRIARQQEAERMEVQRRAKKE